MNEPRIIPAGEVLPPMEAAPRRRERTEAAAADGKGKRRHADRFAVLNGFVDAGMRGLSRAELHVWLALYRDTRNGTARTSAADIANRAGLSRRAVTKATAKLRRRRLLTLVYRGGLNRGPSAYRVHPVPP
jgi:CRP-like cAMP-binding protein